MVRGLAFCLSLRHLSSLHAVRGAIGNGKAALSDGLLVNCEWRRLLVPHRRPPSLPTSLTSSPKESFGWWDLTERALMLSRMRPTASTCGWSGNSRIICFTAARLDRKSTRLNSSHTVISYAVFCLKKKTRIAFDLYLH